MLVGEALRVEVALELPLEDVGEDVLEGAVVGLEDGVLRREVHRVLALQSVGERRSREVLDGLVEVVHPHRHAAVGAVARDEMLDRLRPVLGRERDGELARTGHLEVGRLVLVAVGVAADDDRLRPPRHEPGDVADDDRLAEHDAAEDVADRAVGRDPHLLEAELLHPRLVRRDRRALDAGTVLLDGVGGVDGHLVVGRVAMLHPEVVVLEVDVEVGVDQPVLDELPDDPRHLVAVELDDRVLDLDLRHQGCAPRSGPTILSTSRYRTSVTRSSCVRLPARQDGDGSAEREQGRDRESPAGMRPSTTGRVLAVTESEPPSCAAIASALRSPGTSPPTSRSAAAVLLASAAEVSALATALTEGRRVASGVARPPPQATRESAVMTGTRSRKLFT